MIATIFRGFRLGAGVALWAGGMAVAWGAPGVGGVVGVAGASGASGVAGAAGVAAAGVAGISHISHISYFPSISYFPHISYLSRISHFPHISYLSRISYFPNISYLSHISYFPPRDTLIVDGRVWEVRPELVWDSVPGAGKPPRVGGQQRDWGVQVGWGRTWAGRRGEALPIEHWMAGPPLSAMGGMQYGGRIGRGPWSGHLGVRGEWQQWGMPVDAAAISDSVVGFVRVPGAGVQQVTRIRYPIGVETDTLGLALARKGEGRWRVEGVLSRPVGAGWTLGMAVGCTGLVRPQPRWWFAAPAETGTPWFMETTPPGVALSVGWVTQWRPVDASPGGNRRRSVRPGGGVAGSLHWATDGSWWLGCTYSYRWPVAARRKGR